MLMWLAAATAGCARLPARSAATVHITIDKVAFQQSDARARVGDTVEWTNNDVIAHTSTSREDAWDVAMEPGVTARAVMKRPGTFEYYCRFHPNMTGRVTVTE
jgi:plastocyanin